MTDEDYIRLAIVEAKKSAQAGGLPLGVVLVKNDTVVCSDTSHVGDLFDPTAHGESYVLRKACQKLKTLDLSNCTLYSMLECCSMCLACASWCSIKRIVFGAFKEDIPVNPYEIGMYHAEEHGKLLTPLGGGTMEVKGGVLREECAKLMENIVNWTP